MRNFHTKINTNTTGDISNARSAELSDFEIDTNIIKKVVIDNKTTYTFLVRPKIIQTKSIFNLTMYFKNDKWETIIMELTPTDSYWQTLKEGKMANYDGTIKPVYSSEVIANAESLNCFTVTVFSFHCTRTGPCESGVCDLCSLCVGCMNYNLCISTPIEESDHFGPVGPPINGGSGGSGGSGGTFYTDPTGYFFDPVNLTIENHNEYVRNERAAELWQSLTNGIGSEREWAVTHSAQYCAAVKYLLDHYTPELAEFIHTTIKQINDNDLEVLDTTTFDDQITDNLPPCVSAVLDDLKTLTNGKFGDVIEKFSGVNPLPLNYKWNVSHASLPEGRAAETDPTVTMPSGVVNTHLNNNLMFDSTELSIARTLIHECFHAYLVNVYRFRDIDKDYATLLNQYALDFKGGDGDSTHHLFFSERLVEPIAEALMEYGTAKGYSLTAEYCNDMAWAGLLETPAFASKSEGDQERITSRLMAETFNNDDNPLSITPVGQDVCP